MLPLLRQKLATQGGEATAAELANLLTSGPQNIPTQAPIPPSLLETFPANVRDQLARLVEFGTLQFQEPAADDGLPVPVELDTEPLQQSVPLASGSEAPEIVEAPADEAINPLPFMPPPASGRGGPRMTPEQLAKGAGKAIAKTAIDVGTGIAGSQAGEAVGAAIGGDPGAAIGRVAGALAAPAGANAMLPVATAGLTHKSGAPQPLGEVASGGGPGATGQAFIDALVRGPTPANLIEMAAGPAHAGAKAARRTLTASPAIPPLLRTWRRTLRSPRCWPAR